MASNKSRFPATFTGAMFDAELLKEKQKKEEEEKAKKDQFFEHMCVLMTDEWMKYIKQGKGEATITVYDQMTPVERVPEIVSAAQNVADDLATHGFTISFVRKDQPPRDSYFDLSGERRGFQYCACISRVPRSTAQADPIQTPM